MDTETMISHRNYEAVASFLRIDADLTYQFSGYIIGEFVAQRLASACWLAAFLDRPPRQSRWA